MRFGRRAEKVVVVVVVGNRSYVCALMLLFALCYESQSLAVLRLSHEKCAATILVETLETACS